MKKFSSERFLEIFLWFVSLSMGLSLLLTLKDMIFEAKNEAFLALEIVLGIMIVLLPKLIAKSFKLYLPPVLYIFFALFIYGSVYLGTIYHFYSVVLYWDKGLHLLSGALLGGFSLSVAGALLDKTVIRRLSPLFLSLYSVAFAVFCGVLWEFYEFTCDSFGMNLQRYMQNGHLLLGRAALMDTMGDLIADFIGAVLFACFIYRQVKKNDSWLTTFFFHKL
ncbi:hypothetical protein [Ligilactobacillus faecis]|uniref:hypothetical protein n=1 Tax=Ligilactobacillus faecis TaxID=762833 RepID=UPI00246920EE|nr:hypothetical protein [Ligilactobacillus faecis]WGN88775.1 hypothetical protein QFX10_06810 [Ligilactobacillus faecis]